LGMDLQPADVDDAAAPADEVVALAAQLDDVAGVNEAPVVCERRCIGADIGARRAVGADLERTVDDLHLDAVAVPPDKVGGKTFAPVVYRETDAGLGRSIGMADRRMRKRPGQAVEPPLASDFAGR